MAVNGSYSQHGGTADDLVIGLTKTDPAGRGPHHPLRLDPVAAIGAAR